jgi:hypothetical protein
MIKKISLLFFCSFFLLSCTHDEYLSCSSGIKDNKGEWRFSCYESIALKPLDSNQDGKLTIKEIHFSADTILEENKKYLLPTNDGLVMLNEFSKCDKTWGNFDTNKDGALDAKEFSYLNAKIKEVALKHHQIYKNATKNAKERQRAQQDNVNCANEDKNQLAKEYIACMLTKNNSPFSEEEKQQLNSIKHDSTLFCK